MIKGFLAVVALVLFIGGLSKESPKMNATKRLAEGRADTKIAASSRSEPPQRAASPSSLDPGIKIFNSNGKDDTASDVFDKKTPPPVKKIMPKNAVEVSPYDILAKNISQKINFKIQDSRTLETRVVKMDGEELFAKIKSDFAYMFESPFAAVAFKNYFSHYYKKNRVLADVVKKTDIDLLDFNNFSRFSSLKEAFMFYKERER